MEQSIDYVYHLFDKLTTKKKKKKKNINKMIKNKKEKINYKRISQLK